VLAIPTQHQLVFRGEDAPACTFRRPLGSEEAAKVAPAPVRNSSSRHHGTPRVHQGASQQSKREHRAPLALKHPEIGVLKAGGTEMLAILPQHGDLEIVCPMMSKNYG
jgi:hypothetical protein